MQGAGERGLPPSFAGNKGVFSGGAGEPTSWYRSQFKELENLGKGGFGTVVKVCGVRVNRSHVGQNTFFFFELKTHVENLVVKNMCSKQTDRPTKRC